MPRRSPRRSPRHPAVAVTAIAGAVLLGLATVGVALTIRDGDPSAVALPGPGAGTDPASADPVVGDADGYIPVGSSISPFADRPAITRLDPALRAAMQRAARDAMADGVPFGIDSGWRSTAYQQKLLDDAVRTYGSLDEARRWVSTPSASHHVTGHAVDIGPTDADSWMQQHGARYGLCQVYANEMWHFELLTTPGGTCPAQKSDAAEG